MLPCRAWRPEGKKCYICSKKCQDFRGLSEPRARDLLDSLTCDPDCEKIVVTSSGPAAVWQNKRTGLFSFIGEHNGRPTYQNNATKEHLYYTFTGAEWLVGPDFRKPHAGQILRRAWETRKSFSLVNRKFIDRYINMKNSVSGLWWDKQVFDAKSSRITNEIFYLDNNWSCFQEFKFSRTLTRAALSDTEDPT